MRNHEYNHKEIEPKWQKYWGWQSHFKTGTDASKPKFYALDMFPTSIWSGSSRRTPSDTATDILSRFKCTRLQRPSPNGMGCLGLPAEQYVMDTGNDPAESAENIANFKRQINALDSYDWDREVNTTDPNYYKWTQWIFTCFTKRFTMKEVPVNWAEELGPLPTKKFSRWTSERGAILCLSVNHGANGCSKITASCWAPFTTWMILTGQSSSRTCNATGLEINWCHRPLAGERYSTSESSTTRPTPLVRPLFYSWAWLGRCYHKSWTSWGCSGTTNTS